MPITLEQAWDFYSNHANLQTLTPAAMRFRIISKDNAKYICPGQVIEYKLSPVLGIPVYWKTEIPHVSAPTFFMDVQRKGPFRLWQHQHYFRAIEGGVEMTDILQYKNPLWLLGELANVLIVKRKLRTVFEFRFRKMEELFGVWPGGQEMKIELH